MTVKRVTSTLNLQAGDRFVVLYGANTSHTFCTSDLLLCDIEQILHRYLKQQGYQRILFYSGVKKLYFLDQQSRDVSRQAAERLRTRLQPSQPNNNSTLKVTPGPLGSRRRLLNSQPYTTANSPTTGRLQDVQILSIFENIMQDTTQKSAVIFSQAEDPSTFLLTLSTR